MEILLGQVRLRLDPQRAIGKGGEADVYDLGDGRALKLFKTDQHPDVRGIPAEEAAARARLLLQQRKLPAFPRGLPAAVIAPEELAFATGTRRAGELAGYAMRLVPGAEPLLRWGEPAFRRAGAPAGQAVEIFRALRAAVEGLHARGVVIGDFNDLNVLVRAAPGGPAEPLLIDADSFQFGSFPCAVFTERFLDPRLCDPAAGLLQPARPFDAESDWFAFAALLVQSLLLVGPWGGIHRPRDPALAVPPKRRALRRLSIFAPEIQLPRAAAPLEALPDDLLHELRLVFDRDERRPLPAPLLDRLAFAACPSCGLEHARAACPRCRPHAAARTTSVVAARGAVTATTLFEAGGLLLAAAADRGALRALHHQGGRFLREDGSEVLAGPRDPALRFFLFAGATGVARGGQLALLRPGAAPVSLAVDACGGEPAASSCGEQLAWSQGGQLFAGPVSALLPSPLARGLRLEPQPLGEVLPQATRLFLGPEFGLGLSRAGDLSLVFSFVPGRRGLAEQLALPRLPGELVSVRCAFGAGQALLLLSLRHQGRALRRALVLDREARLVAEAEGEEGDQSWLSDLPGVCGTGPLFFAATEQGIVRLEARAGRLVETRRFPDTEPFVDAQTRLLPGEGGLLAAGERSVRLLRLG